MAERDEDLMLQREYQDDVVMYRTTDAPPPTPAPKSGLPGVFDDPVQDKFFADVMALVISQLRQEFKHDVKREVGRVKRDLRRIRAALVTELSLRLDEQNKLATRTEGEVIDLPKDFLRRDLPRSAWRHDAA